MSISMEMITLLFGLLLLYYSVLTVAGIYFRKKSDRPKELLEYPSVSVFVPAHNEEKVIAKTIEALILQEYPGERNIYILNDNSKDNTGAIIEQFSSIYPYVHHIKVPPGTPSGKARVLNYGLSISKSDYVVVYDADNQPEPNALRYLVEASEQTPNACGAVGYVKTLNEQKNLLTKMIALEFSIFQLVMQAGRWQLFKLGSLTGTNMLVKRSALAEVGGWDPYALAEDADLTMSLTAKGWLLPIVPHSRTWEQEPETLSIWIRQRTRWMQGNLYIIGKTFQTPEWMRGRNALHTIQLLSVYIGFVALLLLSDVWFILGMVGAIHMKATAAPLLLIWFETWLIYVIQLMSAQTVDKTVRPNDILVATLMYFTYAQLWIYLLFRGMYKQIVANKNTKGPVWD